MFIANESHPYCENYTLLFEKKLAALIIIIFIRHKLVEKYK